MAPLRHYLPNSPEAKKRSEIARETMRKQREMVPYWKREIPKKLSPIELNKIALESAKRENAERREELDRSEIERLPVPKTKHDKLMTRMKPISLGLTGVELMAFDTRERERKAEERKKTRMLYYQALVARKKQ